MKKLVLFLSFCFFLISCAKEEPANYDVSEVGKLKKVVSGTIVSQRAVTFHRQLKQEDKTSSNVSNDFVDGGQGHVYVIRLNNGSMVSVAQAEDLKLKVKQKVLVIYGKTTRVLADNSSN